MLSRAADLLGNLETPSSGIMITVDNTPPTVTITSPLAGSILSGTLALITGSASDVEERARNALTYIEVSVDGGESWSLAVGTATWVYTWTLPVENSIAHTLLARATSTSGKVGTSPPVTVTVDTIAQEVIVVKPQDGSTTAFSNGFLVIQFSEAVQPGSLSYLVTPDPGGWGEAWSADGTRLTLVHENRFTFGTLYNVTLEITDLADNPIASPYQWSFTTAMMEYYYPLIFR